MAERQLHLTVNQTERKSPPVVRVHPHAPSYCRLPIADLGVRRQAQREAASNGPLKQLICAKPDPKRRLGRRTPNWQSAIENVLEGSIHGDKRS